MSTRALIPWRVAACALLAASVIATVGALWASAREADASDRLYAARVQLQRAESRLATLSAGAARLGSATLSQEALSLSILEAAARAAKLPGVSAFSHRLDVEAGAISTLRLTLRASVAHEATLLTLLDTLRTASPMRPRRIAGCRLLRGEGALVIACAIDWSWWAFA